MKSPNPRATARFVIAVAVCALAPRLTAQDVTVAPLARYDSGEPLAELPSLGPTMQVTFPEALRKTPDIGWAMFDIDLDDRGTVTSMVIHATQPAYRTAAGLAKRDSRKYRPARRAGQPVESRIRVAVIFNPASAGPKGPDATPRLLDAAVVVDPGRKSVSRAETETPRVVWGTLTVDARGAVQAVADLPGELVPLLEPAAKHWRFAPARRAGVAVSAEVRVPFVVVAPRAPREKGGTAPRAITKVPPVYPAPMLRSGLRGEVLMEFIVDTGGRVRNAIVVRTLNPGFNEAALAAIRQWTFEPARVEGRAVEAKMQQSIYFAIGDAEDGGGDGLSVRRRAVQSKLPEGLRYDTAPKPAATVAPKYPHALLPEGPRGSAEVGFIVDATGKVTMTKIIKADRPEFGYALQAAVERFEYEPALKKGQPAPAMVSFKQDFDAVDLPNAAERAAQALERRHPERILKGRDLDARLKPILTVPPFFPRSIELDQDGGEAVVEFLVDEQGRVCAPRIVSASHPAFGYAAVQAVSGWGFDPPLSKGKAGVVRVTVPFEFKRPAAAAP